MKIQAGDILKILIGPLFLWVGATLLLLYFFVTFLREDLAGLVPVGGSGTVELTLSQQTKQQLAQLTSEHTRVLGCPTFRCSQDFHSYEAEIS